MQQNNTNRYKIVCKLEHALRKRFLVDPGSIFECFLMMFGGILAKMILQEGPESAQRANEEASRRVRQAG